MLYKIVILFKITTAILYFSLFFPHSWHEFRNTAQLWKLFSYITIRILKLSCRNCVSSLQSTHYRTFLFTGQFDLTRALNLAQKSIGTPIFYRVPYIFRRFSLLIYLLNFLYNIMTSFLFHIPYSQRSFSIQRR